MKTAFKAIVLLLLVAYLVWVVVKFARPTEKQVCQDVKVCLRDTSSGNLVTEDYVHDILTSNKVVAKGVCLSDINLRQIDSLLTNAPYISQASCHFSASGVLCVDVQPMHPVMHVFQDNGEEYYVADGGQVMPLGLHDSDLCVVSGHLNRRMACKSLLPMVRFIHDDEFWRDQVEQIYVARDGQVQLVPRVGNHIVVMGDASNYRDKLRRLRVFYQKGMPRVGWNTYRTINLTYSGQVVCTK